uniref:Uncharacterized protein n=1 Tax=Physcomitrium patens TaxID=3218 RepID=A0A2K1J7F1_PHYPA|nr:hypothetical protein PHYPA_020560 [Physcomitrium patens]
MGDRHTELMVYATAQDERAPGAETTTALSNPGSQPAAAATGPNECVEGGGGQLTLTTECPAGLGWNLSFSLAQRHRAAEPTFQNHTRTLLYGLNRWTQWMDTCHNECGDECVARRMRGRKQGRKGGGARVSTK